MSYEYFFICLQITIKFLTVRTERVRYLKPLKVFSMLGMKQPFSFFLSYLALYPIAVFIGFLFDVVLLYYHLQFMQVKCYKILNFPMVDSENYLGSQDNHKSYSYSVAHHFSLVFCKSHAIHCIVEEHFQVFACIGHLSLQEDLGFTHELPYLKIPLFCYLNCTLCRCFP